MSWNNGLYWTRPNSWTCFCCPKKKRALSLAELFAVCLAVWSAKATWWTYKCRLRSSIYVLRNRMSYQITKQLDCLDSFALPGQGPVLLSPGIHSFPFKLGLPLGLPSTFLGKHGWVQYYCKAVSYFGLIYFNGSTFRTRHFGSYQSMMMARSISVHEIHHIIVINAAMCFWKGKHAPDILKVIHYWAGRRRFTTLFVYGLKLGFNMAFLPFCFFVLFCFSVFFVCVHLFVIRWIIRRSASPPVFCTRTNRCSSWWIPSIWTWNRPY